MAEMADMAELAEVEVMFQFVEDEREQISWDQSNGICSVWGREINVAINWAFVYKRIDIMLNKYSFMYIYFEQINTYFLMYL